MIHDDVNWGLTEWAVGAVWTAALTIAGFLWRLSSRVKILEDGVEMREENTERRHRENLAAWDRIDARVAQLTARLDGIVDNRINPNRR